MRYISLGEVKEGMRLAYNLYDSFGRTLIGNGCVLTEYYIDKLYDYGVDGIYIEDELSEGIEIESIISPVLRAEGVVCVREGDIDACHDVAKRMVKEILEKGKISLDLADLRTYDDYTYAHSVNVAVVACVIGIGLQFDEIDLTNLVTAALLHDIGKLQVPSQILNKPGRLTQEEYQIMKSHATLSYELICERWDFSMHVKDAVWHHHENVDGTGYPEGIEGSEQSIFTKILHVADVYDALVSRRPYKEPYSPHEATEYLMGGCGIMFDKQVVEALMRYVPLYPKGTAVVLSDNRKGIIYENSGVHNLRPIIRLMNGRLLDLMETENFHLTLKSGMGETVVSPEYGERERDEMIKPLPRYHIMAVDDMKTNLQMLKSILEEFYELTLVKSGKQAIKFLEKNDYPDLILMDIDMPEMNGIEAARRILEMTDRQILILFVTALCDRETVAICRELDVAGYIVRPYKPVYIKSEIKRIVTGRGDIDW